MPEIKIVEEKPISMAELKEELKEIKKRDTELSFRTAKVSEQVDLLKVVKPKDAEEMFEKIQKLNVPRLKDVHIYKIIDLLPQNIVELKNIVQSYSLTVTNENLEKVLGILADYSPKKK
jgi:DNA-directed RNA polymerase subunit F